MEQGTRGCPAQCLITHTAIPTCPLLPLLASLSLCWTILPTSPQAPLSSMQNNVPSRRKTPGLWHTVDKQKEAGFFSFFFLFLSFYFFFLSFFFWPRRAACRILVLQPGIEPRPLQWKCQVLTTGPPGNSQEAVSIWGKGYVGWEDGECQA